MVSTARLARNLRLGSLTLLAACLVLGAPAAQARVDVGIGIGLPIFAPPIVVAPPPVYYAPPPVYYAPPPTYYYEPGYYSGYYGPTYGYGGGVWWVDRDGRRHWRRH